MRKMIAIGGGLAAAATLLAGGAAYATAPGTFPTGGDSYISTDAAGGHKITICHRTGAATNPYVVITVDVAAVDGNGYNDHSNHDGVGNAQVSDVIPPFPAVPGGVNWSNNWAPGTSAQMIRDLNLCSAPSPSSAPAPMPS